MNSEEQRDLMGNPGWREFRQWVKTTVEIEAKSVQSMLEDPKLDVVQARRDAFEDVWAMILAYEQEIS